MPRRSETKKGCFMYFVYSLQSENNPDRYYVGLTSNVERRLEEHNAGKSIHTNKFKPWRLIGYTAFFDKGRAEKFEAYLKMSSGRAFAKKRL
jgi:putative endonuclease